MYYPCSENKGADQLRGYPEADLRLCFRICKKLVFSRRGSNGYNNILQVNPLVTNRLSHPYHLDESTFIFRGFGSDFFSFLFHFSMKIN